MIQSFEDVMNLKRWLSEQSNRMGYQLNSKPNKDHSIFRESNLPFKNRFKTYIETFGKKV